jgi:enamine deaminase RidA (YjgF/YER057c/UK114 family)
MSNIQRLGESHRWSDVVIHGGVAYWVEVAADTHPDAAGQIAQVLAQIDATLAQIGSRRENLLQVLIYLADLADGAALNPLWDAWVPAGHAPVRACVGAALGPGCRVEMIVTAATGSASDVAPTA